MLASWKCTYIYLECNFKDSEIEIKKYKKPIFKCKFNQLKFRNRKVKDIYVKFEKTKNVSRYDFYILNKKYTLIIFLPSIFFL